MMANDRIRNARDEKQILYQEVSKHIVIKTFEQRKKEGGFVGKFRKEVQAMPKQSLFSTLHSRNM